MTLSCSTTLFILNMVLRAFCVHLRSTQISFCKLSLLHQKVLYLYEILSLDMPIKTTQFTFFALPECD